MFYVFSSDNVTNNFNSFSSVCREIVMRCDKLMVFNDKLTGTV